MAPDAGRIPQARTNDSKAKQAAGERLPYPVQRNVLRRHRGAISERCHECERASTFEPDHDLRARAHLDPGTGIARGGSRFLDQRGAYRNPAGEWCCGDNDCESPDRVAVTGKGWVVRDTEFVPFEEAMPSPDGKVWICRRPDRTRRCVFGPPPGS